MTHPSSLLTPHSCIYLDYNGTTPIDPEVYDAMIPYFTKEFGNPSSSHAYGQQPKHAILQARQRILRMLLGGVEDNADDDPISYQSIIFTGCGTESNHLAIHLAIQIYHSKRYENQKTNNSSNISESNTTTTQPQPPQDTTTNDRMIPHIVTSNVEHPAIAAYLQGLEKHGKCQVTYVPVQTDGRIIASDMMAAIRLNQTYVRCFLHECSPKNRIESFSFFIVFSSSSFLFNIKCI
jgi:cysteine desulfurase